MFGKPNSAALAFQNARKNPPANYDQPKKPGKLDQRPGQPKTDHKSRAAHHLGLAQQYAGNPKGALAVHLKLAAHHLGQMGGDSSVPVNDQDSDDMGTP